MFFRLINLNTLGRPTSLKESRSKTRGKPKNTIESEKNVETFKAVSPTFSEPPNEFLPSEDEEMKVNDDVPLMVSFCYPLIFNGIFCYRNWVDKNHCI